MDKKRTRFVEEYLIDLNAAGAFKRAGYKAKSNHVAAVGGHRLLRNPDIANAISKAESARLAKLGLKAETVLNELFLIATSDIGAILGKPISQLPSRVRRVIASAKH